MTEAWQTHDVTNQVPPLVDYNLYATDTALQAAVAVFDADWHAKELHRQGARLGEAEVQQWAQAANRHEPELQSFDARGNRIDHVEFHPAWHALMGLLRGAQLQSLPWAHPRGGVMAARTASYFLHAQNEAGALCPTTMTFASIPVLMKEAALFPSIKDKLLAPQHDPRDVPLAQKHAMLVGMGMTEKQGGSDVRTNTTVATDGGRGEFSLVGHKWFFSAPQCDAHLVLAREGDTDALSCFFVPRYRPDGGKNAVQVQRLKDKLGNRSNASSEVEFLGAFGTRVGAPGRGVPTIIEMATYTRLDCVIGSAAMMRAGVVQAIHHARHRAAFGAKLVDQDLMTAVLADLSLESEAATWLAMRLARAFDASAADDDSPVERAWRRVVLPAAKFWVCKRALELAGECMEVWGGNGYVETGPLARLYRALHRFDDLEQTFDRHAKGVEDPTRKAELLMQAARVLMADLGSPDRAAFVCERVLAIVPGHLEALALTSRRWTAGWVDDDPPRRRRSRGRHVSARPGEGVSDPCRTVRRSPPDERSGPSAPVPKVAHSCGTTAV